MNQTLLSVVFVCASVPAVGQEDLKTGIEQEIHRLGSDRPEEREKAVQDLKGRGNSVLPALKKALAEAKDPEVTVRLNRLIRNLEPLALEAIEEYLSNAKVEIIVVNAWKDPFVRKTLPEVSFFQLWKRGQVMAWKVLGFDEETKTLFDSSDPTAWTIYEQKAPGKDLAVFEKARRQIALAAQAPHASVAAYSGAPSLSLMLKLDRREINVWVLADGHTLEARSLEGKPLWETDVEPVCRGNIGAPVVRYLQVQDGNLSIVFGKHSHAVLDLKSGKVLTSGSD